MVSFSRKTKIIITLIIIGMIIAFSIIFYEKYIYPLAVMVSTWIRFIFSRAFFSMLMAFMQRSIMIKIKDSLFKFILYSFILSNLSVRRKASYLKDGISERIKGYYSHVMALNMWVKVALVVAFLTLAATSSYLIFALMMIPPSVLRFLKVKLIFTMKKTGILKGIVFFRDLIVPKPWTEKSHLFLKWKLGRGQIKTGQKMDKIYRRISKK